MIEPNSVNTDLSVIDSFLAEKGSKQVLKQAIQFVKPFFLNTVDEMLKERAY